MHVCIKKKLFFLNALYWAKYSSYAEFTSLFTFSSDLVSKTKLKIKQLKIWQGINIKFCTNFQWLSIILGLKDFDFNCCIFISFCSFLQFLENEKKRKNNDEYSLEGFLILFLKLRTIWGPSGINAATRRAQMTKRAPKTKGGPGISWKYKK